MDAAGYTTLTRQSGLMREIQAIANNIANSSTSGFRREGVVFSEYVQRLDDSPSLSMARASGRNIDLTQGDLNITGGSYDFAIQGEGFFLLETPNGNRLSRAGSFMPAADGNLVNPDGYRLLDAGGAPIFVPPDAGPVALATGLGQLTFTIVFGFALTLLAVDVLASSSIPPHGLILQSPFVMHWWPANCRSSKFICRTFMRANLFAITPLFQPLPLQ